jgi:hypothetical protein
MANRAERQMDADEFLLWCLDQEDRYELVNGFPVKMGDGPQMMTGASRLQIGWLRTLSSCSSASCAAANVFPRPPTSLSAPR